jgi:hypothetical protein
MFHGREKILGLEETTITDFWQWAYSDMLSKRNQAAFAEFLVAHSLEMSKIARTEWSEVSIRYKRLKISVSSSGYHQNWRKSAARISFDIAPRKGLGAQDVRDYTFTHRLADLYVFCFFCEEDLKKANVIDVSQWEFYIIPTKILNEQYENRRTIGIKTLRKLADALSFEQLKEKVDEFVK